MVCQVPCGDVSKRWSVWSVVRYWIGSYLMVGRLRARGMLECPLRAVASGFDIPCLLLGALFRRCLSARWWVFCWDPPALTWRDRRGRLVRLTVSLIDAVFRIAVRHADRLVLNIHPGLLSEIAYEPPRGQLVLALNGAMPETAHSEWQSQFGESWTIGILSRGTTEKGFRLVVEAFLELALTRPRLAVRWIGEIPDAQMKWLRTRFAACGVPEGRFELVGPLRQDKAFCELSKCGILLMPYLDVPSLRWNYPLKLAEYFQLGRCVVAADMPGARAYVADQENGRLFRAGSADDLRRVLEELLGDAREQARLGAAAKRRAPDFEWPPINRTITDGLLEE